MARQSGCNRPKAVAVAIRGVCAAVSSKAALSSLVAPMALWRPRVICTLQLTHDLFDAARLQGSDPLEVKLDRLSVDSVESRPTARPERFGEFGAPSLKLPFKAFYDFRTSLG